MDLIFRRKLISDNKGYFRLSIPPEIAAFLGGGQLALLIDRNSPVPSVVLRPDVAEASIP